MLRAFKCTFLVAINEQEAIQGELREEGLPAVDLDELKDYLKKAVVPGWNDEEYGNPVGIASLEILFEELKELSPTEMKRRYIKRKRRSDTD